MPSWPSKASFDGIGIQRDEVAFVFYPFSFHDNLAKQLKVKKLTEWIGHVLDLPNQMTDIEQQIAQASGTRKSTAILADPEHVTEPLQILPFVTLFFKTYSKMNRKTYEETYNLAIYRFARMLIGFTDPPNLGTIMNNGDYFIYWMQSSTKLEAWFSEMQQMVRDNDEEDGTYWQKLVSYFRKQDKVRNGDASALAVVVIGMFEKLDEQYRFFQRALIEKESAAVKTLDTKQKINNNEWVNRMDSFLKKRAVLEKVNDSNEGQYQWISDYAKQFVDKVLLPMDVGSPFPMDIGAKLNPVGKRVRKLDLLEQGKEKTTSSRQQQQQQPPDPASLERMDKETKERTNNSVIEHYRNIIEDFGNHMMELFRSFNFPPVFTLDNPPSFTAEWQGYVDLAYRSFYDLARQRHAYLQKIGGSTFGSTIPRWTLEQIFKDEDASGLFAEFVGYKKAVPQNTVAPAPNVQRTNATYHYALNNMSLRFVSLYDYMVQKEMERGRGKRMSPFLISSLPKKK